MAPFRLLTARLQYAHRMNCACADGLSTGDVWAIGGGVLQVIALTWGWLALYRLWRLRWRESPLIPWLVPVRAWLARQWERLRYWMTLIPRRVTGHGVSRLDMTLSGHGTATVTYADNSIEARLARAEERFRLMEEHHADEMRRVFDAIAAVTDAQRADWANRDDEAKRTTRNALIGPAAFAGVGTIAQVVALLL